MNRIMINNIEIRYDDNINCKIDYIKNVISNNYNLFLSMIGESQVISLVPTNEDGVVYISDFDKTFYEVVNKIFNNDGNNTLFEIPELLPGLYIESLVRKAASNQRTLVQPNPNVTDEMLYSLIAYIYFLKTGTFSDFVNYLKDKKDINKILNWLQSETRFEAYNYLLEITTNYLKENDFDFLDNISDITNKMLNQLMSNIFTQEVENEIQLPSITTEEFDSLFYEFLQSINAPESWKQMYNDLKERGRISFENLVDNIDNSKCYRDENGILRLLISTDGTINCFCSFAHEFAHYVTIHDAERPSQFSITEFPSIFFEKLSAEFLKNKGYKVEIVDKVIKDRNQNNFEIYIGLSPLFNDILRFIKKGPILKSDKVELWENQFRIIRETKEKLIKKWQENGESIPDMRFLEQPKVDIDNEVDKECDSYIDSFIQNGLLVINGYQYLLDTYLAEEVLKKCPNDPTIIPRMINATNNLSNMNLTDILIEFDIQDLFGQSKEKIMLNQKTK